MTHEVDLLRNLGYKAYSVKDFDYNVIQAIKEQKRGTGNPGRKNPGKKYADCVCAFDIETSTIPGIDQAIMYIWQFALDDMVIIGRTWREFLYFCKKLEEYRRKDGLYFVTFVHNLAFEFQYLSGIYKFCDSDIFATDSRKPAKAYFMDVLELRCSYLHSNMSLDEFTHKMGAQHSKANGADFDYKKMRWPDTELTAEELVYCVNDVLGLVEAIKIEMEIEHDDLYSIPMTSTGYVRREMRRVIDTSSPWIKTIKIQNINIYRLLRQAFRGGNTHGSRFYAGKILENVKNVDISSSYPDCIMNCKYPLKEFKQLDKKYYNIDYVLRMIDKGKALLIDFSIYDLELKDKVPVPYLSLSKCTEISFTDLVTDNGRVMSAGHIRTVMTDIDFSIFVGQYEGSYVINNVLVSYYQELPDSIKELTIKYFHDKTKYKNATGREAVYYTKQKNKLNAIYGMTSTDPLTISTHYDGENWYNSYDYDLETLLEKSNNKSYYPYAIGVWVTAHARRKLQDMIDFVGAERFVYCDTDSVKYLGEVDIEKLNEQYRAISERNGAYCDFNGKRYYMGIYETERPYKRYKTLGSKKYVWQYEGEDKTYCTIAGVRKNSVYNSAGEIVAYGGGDELDLHNGIESFKEGFIFKLAGGNEVKYNDKNLPITYTREDGKKFKITRNVVIKDGEYKLDTTQDYFEILHSEQVEKVFRDFCKSLEEELKHG